MTAKGPGWTAPGPHPTERPAIWHAHRTKITDVGPGPLPKMYRVEVSVLLDAHVATEAMAFDLADTFLAMLINRGVHSGVPYRPFLWTWSRTSQTAGFTFWTPEIEETIR